MSYASLPLWYQIYNVLAIILVAATEYDAVVAPDFVTLRICPFPFPCHDDRVSLWA